MKESSLLREALLLSLCASCELSIKPVIYQAYFLITFFWQIEQVFDKSWKEEHTFAAVLPTC